MTAPAQSKFTDALQRIDALHAQDPEKDPESGKAEEQLYAERMSAWLIRLYPDADERLRLAARAQHLCRWRLRRADYPAGKAGYKQWRKDEAALHAQLAGECLQKAGYDDAAIARVQFLVRKRKLKVDPQTQALEDTACLVFLEHYFEPFAAKYLETGEFEGGEDKVIDIVQKTWAKMSPRGHQAALGLTLPEHLTTLVKRALAPGD